MISVKIRGLKQIDAQLKALGSVEGTRIIRGAMYAATKPIVEATKQNVAAIPEGSGALHLSIVRKFSRLALGAVRLGGRFIVYIAPALKQRRALALYSLHYGRRIGGIFYGHLVEWGFRARNGRRVAGREPFGRALRSTSDRAISVFGAEVRKRIDKQLAKNRKAS